MDPRYRIISLFAGMLLIACISLPAQAQISNIEELIRAGQEDAQTLTQASVVSN